jgi:hypothetical protein
VEQLIHWEFDGQKFGQVQFLMRRLKLYSVVWLFKSSAYRKYVIPLIIRRHKATQCDPPTCTGMAMDG